MYDELTNLPRQPNLTPDMPKPGLDLLLALMYVSCLLLVAVRSLVNVCTIVSLQQ